MRITMLTGVTCTPDRGKVVDIDSARFLAWLGDPQKCPSVECADEPEKLRGAGFVFAQYRPGAKAKSNDNLDPKSETDLLCYDIDDTDLESVVRAARAWERVDAVVYSTWKHTPARPRVRFIVRLTKPISNATETPFRRIYATVAYLLKIPADPLASNRANFYFGPQHKPGELANSERMRYRGEPLDTDAVIEVSANGAVPQSVSSTANLDFEGARFKPDKSQLRALVRKLTNGNEREQWIGAALDAMLRGERFAVDGSVHSAMAQVAFELVRAIPLIDADWFAEKYLEASWSVMWPGESPKHAFTDWRKCVRTAEAKIVAGRADKAEQAARYAPEISTELDDIALERAANVAGALICEHRGAYYVYNPRTGHYNGPLKGTGLAAACRRCLVGVPGFSYQTFRSTGPPVLKSGPRLVEEYGTDIESVHYYATEPDTIFDKLNRSIHIPAYRWNLWDPIFHEIADDLLHALAGAQYERLAAWLSRVRDLGQPLPALTMVGTRGTWKSRLAQTISRFWGPPGVATPCSASQVLNRFSGPLLTNPVIWSDECLAHSDTGRPIPEAYRRSITELVHAVERKGVDPVSLHTATRHVISVNDSDRVFGGEIDAASVEATIERYLVIRIDGKAIAAFEKRWARKREIERLRTGETLLEHIRWIEENTSYDSQGRLFVDTDTDAELLLRARFADDTLSLAIGIAIDALFNETRLSVVGNIERLPLVCDNAGQLRMSPARITDLWADSRLTAGSAVRKPTTQRLGRMLQKAGFKSESLERATDSRRWRAWRVNHKRLREYLHVASEHTWEDIADACKKVFGYEPLIVPK